MENMGVHDTPVFPLMELKHITDNFSDAHVIGRGGSGVVYKGIFDNGEVIAVKKLHNQYDSFRENLSGEAQFCNELMNLFGVQHENIVRLVGYCYEIQHIVTEYDGKRVIASVEERVLCLEYLQGGSLKNYISDKSGILKWHSCYNIIKGICEGLKYLHTGCKNPIIHQDLKPENILMTTDMIPKICDFGISRLHAASMQTCVTQNISGTLGYMPPEYIHRKEISPKFDIFSLGVIMILVIAGHEGNREYPYMPPQEFVERVHEIWRERLQPTNSSHLLEQVMTCTEIALRCVEFHREKRPTITEIIDELNKIDSGGSSDRGQNPKEEEQHLAQSVDLATGALGSLLAKLLYILSNKYKLAQRKKNIEDLYIELESMHSILLDVAGVLPDQLQDVFNFWAEEVRELSYDAEDIVDSFLWSLETTKLHGRQTANCKFFEAIDVIIGRVQDLSRSRPMYKVNTNDDVGHPLVTDQRFLTIQKDLKEIVGIEVSKNEVLRMLELVDGRAQLGRHIVSIVGMVGLGKTTLARAVYDTVREQYDCSLWVSLSHNPDIKKVFMEILTQIDNQKYMQTNTENFDGRMLIDEVRIQLANKRCLIIIDDIWDVRSWEIIESALVDMRNGSNVVTTTQNFDVAEKADDVYKLKAISCQYSAELFNTRLFSGKEKVSTIPPEIIEKILQKCGGVPLAIITMASLLAEKPRYEWPKVYNSIGFGYEANEVVKDTRKILLLIYNDLPYYVKHCLVYISMFPQNYSIRKETLIWMWVAEGLVTAEKGIGSFEVGEKYFSELVKRSLIIPAEDSSYGIINGWRAHELVLDLISYLSTNFVTIVDEIEQHDSTETDRRFAIRDTSVEQHDHLAKLSEHLRSFTTIRCHFGMMVSFSRFILLRVLSIEECTFKEYDLYDLKHIEELCHLRYLGLYNTPIRKFPNGVGDLIHLETLDLRGTMVKLLPLRVKQLSKLKCLRADERMRVPDWIGNLTSLEELLLEDVSKSPIFVGEVGKLKELRELEFSIERLDKSLNKILVESLSVLTKIQVLRLMSSRPVEEANWESYVPPRQLRELRLHIAFPRLPKWIDASLVPNLSHLYLNVEALCEEEMVILGNLPELISLELLMPSDVFCNIKGNGIFPKLRCFHTSTTFRFLPGAISALEFLHFKVDVRALRRARFSLDNFASLENLRRLQRVEVEINSRGARQVHVVEAEEMVKRTMDNHPNHPTSDIKRT